MNAAHTLLATTTRRCAALSMLALGSLLTGCGGGEQPEPSKPVLDEAAMRLRVMSASPAAASADVTADVTGAVTAVAAAVAVTGTTATPRPEYTPLPTAAWATADGRVLVCGDTAAPGGCELWSPADGQHTALGDAAAADLLPGATALGQTDPAATRHTFAASGAVAAAALPATRFMVLPASPNAGKPGQTGLVWPAEAAVGPWLLFGIDAEGRPVSASRVQVQVQAQAQAQVPVQAPAPAPGA